MKKLSVLLLLLTVSMLMLVACFATGDPGDEKENKCADGHTFGEYVSLGDATCTEDGTKFAKCKYCTKKDAVTDEGSALGHDLGDYIANDDNSCAERGTMTAYCSRCDHTDTKEYDGALPAHSYAAYLSDENATCTEDGTKTARCEVCGVTDTVTDEGSKLVHVFGEYVFDNNATCTSDGTKTAVCNICGSETHTVVDVGTKRPHDMGDYVVTKNPTCTAEGLEVSKCNDCPYTESRPVAVSLHSYDTAVWGYVTAEGHAHKCVCGAHDTVLVHTPGPAATESEPQKCLDCGYVIAPAVGHTHVFDQKTVTPMAEKSASTCTAYAVYFYSCACSAISDTLTFEHTEGGYKAHDFNPADCGSPKKCKDCEATEGEPTGEHSFKDADCTNPKTCTVCGATEGEPLGHSFSGGDCKTPESCSVCGAQGETKAHTWAMATCTDPKTCRACGVTEGDPLGHDMGPVTCTRPSTCKRAGCYYYEGEALGHDYTEATCTEAKKCKVCDTVSGEPLGHKFGDWVQTVPPTFDKMGEQRHDCERCGHFETKPVPDLNPDNDGSSDNMDPGGWTPIG